MRCRGNKLRAAQGSRASSARASRRAVGRSASPGSACSSAASSPRMRGILRDADAGQLGGGHRQAGRFSGRLRRHAQADLPVFHAAGPPFCG